MQNRDAGSDQAQRGTHPGQHRALCGEGESGIN